MQCMMSVFGHQREKMFMFITSSVLCVSVCVLKGWIFPWSTSCWICVCPETVKSLVLKAFLTTNCTCFFMVCSVLWLWESVTETNNHHRKFQLNVFLGFIWIARPSLSAVFNFLVTTGEVKTHKLDSWNTICVVFLVFALLMSCFMNAKNSSKHLMNFFILVSFFFFGLSKQTGKQQFKQVIWGSKYTSESKPEEILTPLKSKHWNLLIWRSHWWTLFFSFWIVKPKMFN